MHKSKVMRKLLGQSVSSINDNVEIPIIDSPPVRPSASQHTVYSGGASIACLDQSSDGSRAVIASSQVFKILSVEGAKITEELDLRGIISAHATTHDPSAATTDQLNIRAVRWSHGTLDTSIITACGNGRITVYDLNRVGDGLEVGRIVEHNRQVHKLDINPFKPEWLLSASQDGTVKSFDIRAPLMGRNGPVFQVWKSFKGNADAVRDVKWSPSDGMEFACSTDAGVVMKWDARKSTVPLLRLTAHPSACFSISWHPDGDFIISGGLDQRCHVWDLSKKAERNQKPKYSFTAPAPINTVSWRPAYWSATSQGKRAAQVIVSYDDANTSRNRTPMVHIWDLARPNMPFKEVEQWNSAPTGILWNTKDLLWSVDREGNFTQTDVAFISQAIDRRTLSNLSFSSCGDVLMFLEERQAPRRARPTIASPEVSPIYQSVQRDTIAPLLSVSHSDDDVVGSFLGPSYSRIPRGRLNSRSTQILSMTPPNTTTMADSKLMSLDAAVKVTGIYKPQQVMAIGHAPSTAKRTLYQYYTNRYLLQMENSNLTSNEKSIDERTTLIMDYYARTAVRVGHFRLAQTWRLLAYVIDMLLKRRSEYHRLRRLEQKPTVVKNDEIKLQIRQSKPQSERGDETPRELPRAQTPIDSLMHPATKSVIIEDPESTSNVATPHVRPVQDTIIQQTEEAMHTPLIVEDEPLKLPGAAHSTSPYPCPIPVPGASSSSKQSGSSLEGYDFYGMEACSPNTQYVAPPRKLPLRLDYADVNNDTLRNQPHRHDSTESFQMFSTSTDSQSPKFMGSVESDRHSLGPDHSRSLRDRVASWESSFGSNSEHSNTDHSKPDSPEIHVTPNSREINPVPPNGLFQKTSVFRLQEASVPPGDNPTPTMIEERPLSPLSPLSSEIMSQDPNILPNDFYPWPNDPTFTISPIDPTVLVQRTIEFEVSTGTLNAAIMILLLRPLLPPGAIDEIKAIAILRAYHQRLSSMKLFSEAALLRNICVPAYPDVFASAQQKTTIGYFCTDCYKSLENDPLISNSVWRCPRCQNYMDECAICKSRDLMDCPSFDTEDERAEMSVWFLCPGCGHGGHTSCMQAWHDGSEFQEGEKHSGGCCPLEGCLHPCLPGKWREKRRDEKAAVKSRELEGLVREGARTGSGSSGGGRAGGPGRGLGVRRDRREVNQSKAVEGVRVALAGGVNVRGVAGAGMERRRSVKLVAPGEERRSA